MNKKANRNQCGDCKQFVEPDECRDRATVYPDSSACEYFEKKGFWKKLFAKIVWLKHDKPI